MLCAPRSCPGLPSGPARSRPPGTSTRANAATACRSTSTTPAASRRCAPAWRPWFMRARRTRRGSAGAPRGTSSSTTSRPSISWPAAASSAREWSRARPSIRSVLCGTASARNSSRRARERCSMPEEIALFGGSFDPPHVGHLLAAAYVLAVEPVDELWLVPVLAHPLGKQLAAPYHHRVALCEALARQLPRARVSRAEEESGRTRTAALLEYLGGEHPGARSALGLGTDP